MIETNINKILSKYNYLLWLFFLIFLTVLVTFFYNQNKQKQISNLKKSLNNTYLKNSIKKITSELNPRYVNIEYTVKQGDTYESIINGLDVPNIEKKKILKIITKNKNLNVLKLNQKISFKIDKKNNTKIKNFIIEIDKKNNIFF